MKFADTNMEFHRKIHAAIQFNPLYFGETMLLVQPCIWMNQLINLRIKPMSWQNDLFFTRWELFFRDGIYAFSLQSFKGMLLLLWEKTKLLQYPLSCIKIHCHSWILWGPLSVLRHCCMKSEGAKRHLLVKLIPYLVLFSSGCQVLFQVQFLFRIYVNIYVILMQRVVL